MVPQQHQIRLMGGTVLMCVQVMILLPTIKKPRRFARLRSAGTMGASVIDELVALGSVPVYIDTTTTAHSSAPAFTSTTLTGEEDHGTGNSSGSRITALVNGSTLFGGITHNNPRSIVTEEMVNLGYRFMPVALPAQLEDPSRRGAELIVSLRAIDMTTVTLVSPIANAVPLRHVTCLLPDTSIASLKQLEIITAKFKAVSISFRLDDAAEASLSDNEEPIPHPHHRRNQLLLQKRQVESGAAPNRPIMISDSPPPPPTPSRYFREVPQSFMDFTYCFKSIDITPLRYLTELNYNFLSHCGVVELDMSIFECLEGIKANLLYRCESLKKITLPKLHCYYDVNNNLIEPYVGQSLLAKCSEVMQVDLQPFSGITDTDSYFLHGCCSIRRIDLSPLVNLTSIGSYFMAACTRLLEINLSTLHRVHRIGSSFLSGCVCLKTVDLRSFSNLHHVPSEFLTGCSGLQEVFVFPARGVGGAVGVSTIDSSFMSDCTKIAEIDLTSLSTVSTIKISFMCGCRGLKQLLMGHMTQLQTIDANFAGRCTNLEHIELPKTIETIKGRFLESCVSLTTLDLGKMEQLLSIEDNFLSGCRRLTCIIPPRRPSLRSTSSSFSDITHPLFKIGRSFLSQCDGISDTSDLFSGGGRGTTSFYHPFHNITHLPKLFLSANINLKIVNLSNLTNIVEFGPDFMKGCTSLETIHLPTAPLPRSCCVESGFLNGCLQLKNIINFDCFSGVSGSIQGDFLKGCRSLRHIDLTPLESVMFIQPGLLEGCTALESITLFSMKHGLQIPPSFMENVLVSEALDESTDNTNSTSTTSASAASPSTLATTLKPPSSTKTLMLDLTPWSRTSKIPNNLFAGCTRLHPTLDLSPIGPHLTHIEDGFLMGCSGLVYLDLSPLTHIKAIGRLFLANCTGIIALDMTPLGNGHFTAMGVKMLVGCSALKTITLPDGNTYPEVRELLATRIKKRVEQGVFTLTT